MAYLLKKLLYGLLVLMGVVALVFVMFQGFGDPARLIVGQTGDQKTLDNIRKELHLDQPRWKQFLYYANDVSPLALHSSEEINQKKLKGFFVGDGERKVGIKVPYLGKSYQTKKSTTEVLMEALPGTLVLAITAMLFACIIGIVLGVVSAVYKNTWIDHTSVFSSIAGISAPSFFMAILVAYLFGIVLHDYTRLNLT
ncbi:MAG: ABC transporter permease, partial [Chitinophagaceae bacterium]